jgi:hypothetical protein
LSAKSIIDDLPYATGSPAAVDVSTEFTEQLLDIQRID